MTCWMTLLKRLYISSFRRYLRLFSSAKYEVNRYDTVIIIIIITSRSQPGRGVALCSRLTALCLVPQVCWRRVSLDGFAPASCCVGDLIYVSMWIVVADPVTRRYGSAGLGCRDSLGQTGDMAKQCAPVIYGTLRST